MCSIVDLSCFLYSLYSYLFLLSIPLNGSSGPSYMVPFFPAEFDSPHPELFFESRTENKNYIFILKGWILKRDKAKSPNLVPAAAAATVQMSRTLLSIGLIKSVQAVGFTQEEIIIADTF